jgi:outer membrane protein assembly factor BamD (BamD/ComL family)
MFSVTTSRAGSSRLHRHRRAQGFLISFLFLSVLLGVREGPLNADAETLSCAAAPDCFNEALRAFNRRDTETGRTLLTELLQEVPNTAWAGRAALILSRQYPEHGNRQAIALLPNVPQHLPILGDYAYYYLGDTLFASSNWNGAATAFDLLHARYPDSVLRPQALYRAAEAWYPGDDCRRAK